MLPIRVGGKSESQVLEPAPRVLAKRSERVCVDILLEKHLTPRLFQVWATHAGARSPPGCALYTPRVIYTGGRLVLDGDVMRR